ncbi:type II CAAX endopeptidase family protein [Pseudoduganella sp. OTU4001]|uniref:type II CAAX endopeptidase family protein n=1 Tax=Pseudoduganella sp. OTU4001 TaxID=3043854 RepID=UPI00313B8792
MDLPSAPRAFWLLARLRLLRLLNIANGLGFRKGWLGPSRQATRGKKSARWIVTCVLSAFMLFAFLNTAHTSLLNMQCRLPTGSQCAVTRTDLAPRAVMRTARQELQAAPFHPVLMRAAVMQASLLFCIAFLLPLGSRELAQPDWDLEWLVTLPMQRRMLLLARIAERTLANPSGILALWPLCMAVAWHSGHRWSTPFIGAACALPLLACAATLRTVADTGLRLRLAPSQLRNLQAIASVASMPLMYLAMSLAMPTATLTLGWAQQFPDWALWAPPGLALQALNTRDPLQGLAYGALLAAQTALLVWLGLRLLHALLAEGVVASGSRETGRRSVALPATPGFAIGTPLQRRELRLLSRDRNFLVQSLLIPVIIFGSQLVLNGQVDNMGQFLTSPSMLASVAFGLAAYVLMLSAFQTINTEGHALWMLYTYPYNISSILAEKAQLWSVLALAYPLAVYAMGVWSGVPLNNKLWPQLVLVMVGIPIFATIAVALGVWACDPLAQDLHARVRPTFAYAYLLLSSLYTYMLNTREWQVRLAVMVLMTALAMALWQRARDAMPYLLDPTASPPPRLSAADGIIGAIGFFTLQLLVTGAMHLAGQELTLPALALSFAFSGAMVYGLTRLIYWRAGTSGVPRLWHGSWREARGNALLWGVLMALPALAAGFLWMAAMRRFGLLPDTPPRATMLWLAPLAVLAAPLFEEFIFRGQVFGGLRRTLSLLPAMATSAALFAVIHPPLAMLPVFALGLCTAYAAERSKSLLAPMLAHSIYNAGMLVLQ